MFNLISRKERVFIIMYPSRTVLVPAHYETIHFTDFGHDGGNIKDYLDYPDLRCCIVLDESCGQYGLLIIAVREAQKEIGTETISGDGIIIMQPVYTQIHWTELPPIHSWNLNYYQQRGETLFDTAERLLNVFNKRWNLHLTLYNN